MLVFVIFKIMVHDHVVWIIPLIIVFLIKFCSVVIGIDLGKFPGKNNDKTRKRRKKNKITIKKI